jgi:hypothetical protein
MGVRRFASVGAWLARDGGLTADHSLPAKHPIPVGAAVRRFDLPAKAAWRLTILFLPNIQSCGSGGATIRLAREGGRPGTTFPAAIKKPGKSRVFLTGVDLKR